MTSPESPAGARRRVRLVLREAREELGLTQAQVAEEMEWSTSKVIRIESGEVTISPNDLRPLLGLLKINDKGRVESLIEAAKVSRRRQTWWNDPDIRPHLTPASRLLIQYEREAVEFRYFSNVMIPGPLQIRAYSEAILTGAHSQLDAEDIRVRLETRGRRRRELLARRPPPTIFLLLEESVLKRRIGSPEITAEQLTDLLRLHRDRKLTVRVLEYSANAPLPLIGPFDLLRLIDESGGDDEVMYRENYLADEVVEDPTVSRSHHESWETWWDAALDEPASTALIEASIKELTETEYGLPGGSSAGLQTKRARAGRRRQST